MTLLKTRIKQKLKEFEDEYKPLNKKFFGKNSSFLDKDLQRGAFLEQRIDDLNNILDGLNKSKKLISYHIDLLKRADIIIK